MNFTFGIVTTPSSCEYLQQIVDSIESENIPNYQIIIVGGNKSHNDDILQIIPFDESIHPGWVSKKKNVITKHAKYENIVYRACPKSPILDLQ